MLRTKSFLQSSILGFLIFCCFASKVLSADLEVENFQKSFNVEGRPQIVVENQDGKTTVRAAEGNSVLIHVIKHVVNVRDEEQARRAAEKVNVRVEQNGNIINVVTEYPKWGFSINIGHKPRVLFDFDIVAPAQSDVKVHESDGPLDVNGFHGNIDLHASDGNITSQNCSGTVSLNTSDGKVQAAGLQGQLEISVSDGAITVDRSSGSLVLRSSDGDTHLTGFNGELQARTADGKLFIDGLLTALTAKTSDGSMLIRLAPGSVMQKDWSIRSADGNVELNIPSSFSAELDLETADGRIETQLPISIVGSVARDHIHGKMNDGGRVLQIHTSDGDITINGE